MSSEDQRESGTSRRAFGKAAALAGGSLVLGLAATPAFASPARPDAGRNGYARRAVAAYDALQRFYYAPDVKLYAPNHPAQPGDNPYAYVYPFSGVITATLGLLRLDRRYASAVRDRDEALAGYYNPSPVSANPLSPPAPASPPGYASYLLPPLGQGGDLFYDDNEWLGLAALQQYRITGDRAALQRARLIFALIRYGWDDDPGHPDPGGTFWTQATYNHDRNTVSNALGVEIGARLYLLTGNRDTLRHSIEMFDWVEGHLKAPNGLYWDHVDLQGTVDTAQLAYNQGNMLGAAALLHLATGERGYLGQARDIAERALETYDFANSFAADVPGAVVLFKNMLLLHSIDPDERYRGAQRACADALWGTVDPSTGLLPAQAGLAVNTQAALVEMQTLAAWSPRDYHLLL
ncbi:glycoside hydrolase family 76 protein [Streptomyces sp. NPDC087270]|uniref:glycoside hydrolase family 76 protein n=1 Tax=Streptomyces sp. NPDC087270 TaxID=3365774 RepID=UPI00380D884D